MPDVVGERGIHSNGRVVRRDTGDQLVPGEPVRKSSGRSSPAGDPGDADDVADGRRDERVKAFLPLEIVPASLARESEDHMLVDEVGLVLPAVAETRESGDGELGELLAHDVANDL